MDKKVKIDLSKHLGYLVVKIIKADSPKAWYYDYIGYTVIVDPSNDFDYTLKLDVGTNRLRWIPRKNCEIISIAT